MAATRKLQGEIDRCLKKVTEGVETFEDIWQKVHNATNSNQKVLEKYEADLKKEIKKLQRLRDQIKSWIASAEIKDKSALLENRRLIETQMERFKVVERETKTKAYSKEGLGAAQKLDPAQRVKDEIRSWLTSSISSLQIQIDQYESEIESLLAGKKKRLDRDKQDRMDELRSKLDRHKFHVTKLETLLRLLDNDGVEAEQVRKIKDDVEYYIESSQDPDFEENEFLYDDIIGLDEVELSGTGISLGIPSSATTDSNNSNETGGSPSSITSGGSPVQSPVPQNCSSNNANNLNYSSDSTSVDITAADKRNKNENNASSKVKPPVKPTAVRVSSTKLGLDANSNNTNNVTSNATGAAPTSILQQTPQSQIQLQSQQQQQQPALQSNKNIVSSTPSKTLPIRGILSNFVNNIIVPTISTASAVGSASSQPQLTTSALVQSQLQLSVANSAPSSTNQVQSVIQPTSSIAFAAVAKNNTSHLESSAYTSAGASIASIVGSNLQQAQLSHTNLQSNSSHPPSESASAHVNTSSSNSIVGGNIAVTSASVANTNSNSNLVNNCISPNSITNSATNSSRASPGLVAPKHQNGPINHKAAVSLPNNNNNTSPDTMSTLKTMAQEAINRSAVDANVAAQQPNVDTRQQTGLLQQQQPPQQQQQQPPQSQHFSPAVTDTVNSTTNGPLSVQNSTGGSNVNALTSNGNDKPTNEAHIPPLLGVAPLGPSPLHKEHQLQFQMMESAYYHLPVPSDSEKLTTYLHRNPVQTPPHYPQNQLPHYDTVDFFQRLSTETLFFVFYYMEGTKAQYLVAKALKKQSWRFHTKYMMWFQRHEEPKIINDDYEQGTYIYFDYEKWGQRKKEGFTFEYKYLEDKDLN